MGPVETAGTAALVFVQYFEHVNEARRIITGGGQQAQGGAVGVEFLLLGIAVVYQGADDLTHRFIENAGQLIHVIAGGRACG